MMFRRKSIFYFLISLLAGSLSMVDPSEATEASGKRENTLLMIGVGLDKPPYIIKSASSGLEIELATAVLEKMGFAAKFVPIPQGRLARSIEDGQVDGAITMHEGLHASFCLSDPYVAYQNVAVTMAKRNLNISSVSDLAHLRVNAFQNASQVLGKEFHDTVAKMAFYQETSDQHLSVLKLNSDRIDAYVGDKRIFLHIANQAIKGFSSKKVRMAKIFKETKYRFGFKNSQFCPLFNKALAELKQRGTYDQILKKYE